MEHARPQITEAEALVGTVEEIYQRRLDPNWTAARALLGGTWRPARPSRELPTQAEMSRVCEELAEAEKRWLRLAIGESITMQWPQQQVTAGKERPARQRRRTSAFSRRATARGWCYALCAL